MKNERVLGNHVGDIEVEKGGDERMREMEGKGPEGERGAEKIRCECYLLLVNLRYLEIAIFVYYY